MIMTFYIDGSCLGNPGRGGWAIVDNHGNKVKDGNKQLATSPEMELKAALEALILANATGEEVRIYSDSEYVVKGINVWLANWIAKGWRGSNRKPVAHKEIWVQIAELLGLVRDRLQVIWVAAHQGDPLNSLADSYAYAAAMREPDSE
jgi:ribonuclease HI